MATRDVAPSSPPDAADSPTNIAAESPAKKRKSSHAEIEVDLGLPEPPSKKAKRLLKKGKVLPGKPKSDDEKDGGEDGSDGEEADGQKKSKKKERSPYGVWVGNLRFFATKSDLRTWLVDNSGGAITAGDITRVHMPMNKEKKGKADGRDRRPEGGRDGEQAEKSSENKGFAYVDFATFEANVAAIALSETEMNGRKLLIKDAKSFEGRPKKEAEEPAPIVDGKQPTGVADKKDKKDKRTKIFVGNLSYQTTEEILWEHFSKCGAIRWAKVATFGDTGKCKGFGWVNFEEPEGAAWAVKGFVKLKETVDTLEDFMDAKEPAVNEDGDVDMDHDEDSAAKEAAHRTKTRKWWVNKLQGRASRSS